MFNNNADKDNNHYLCRVYPYALDEKTLLFQKIVCSCTAGENWKNFFNILEQGRSARFVVKFSVVFFVVHAFDVN